MNWFRKDALPLTPGVCECEHDRCCHVNGRGKCQVCYPPDKEWPTGAQCACQIFILDRDNDDGDEAPDPIDPEVAELNKLMEK